MEHELNAGCPHGYPPHLRAECPACRTASVAEHEPATPEGRTRALSLLRERGWQDAEACAALVAWREAEEAKIPGGPEGAEGDVGLMLAQADLFAEAGLVAEALEQLDDAYMSAEQQGNAALLAEIERRGIAWEAASAS